MLVELHFIQPSQLRSVPGVFLQEEMDAFEHTESKAGLVIATEGSCK